MVRTNLTPAMPSVLGIIIVSTEAKNQTKLLLLLFQLQETKKKKYCLFYVIIVAWNFEASSRPLALLELKQ
jgi:hypothetical protein